MKTKLDEIIDRIQRFEVASMGPAKDQAASADIVYLIDVLNDLAQEVRRLDNANIKAFNDLSDQ